jgi:hypothetical protein
VSNLAPNYRFAPIPMTSARCTHSRPESYDPAVIVVRLSAIGNHDAPPCGRALRPTCFAEAAGRPLDSLALRPPLFVPFAAAATRGATGHTMEEAS